MSRWVKTDIVFPYRVEQTENDGYALAGGVAPYISVLPLALAVVVYVRGRRRPRVTALTATACLLALLSLGCDVPGYRLIGGLPPFSFFYAPRRYLFGVVLCMGLLAGTGLDVAPIELRRSARGGARWFALVLLLLAPIAFYFRYTEMRTAVGQSAPAGRIAGGVLLSILLSAPVLCASCCAFRLLAHSRPRWRSIAVFVVAADLIVYGLVNDMSSDNPSLRELAIPCPVLKALPPAQDTDLRQAGEMLFPRPLAGYRDLSTCAMTLAPTRMVWVQSHALWFRTPSLADWRQMKPILRALHVGYVLAHDEIPDSDLRLIYKGPPTWIRDRHKLMRAYQLRAPMPRAYLIDRAVWVATPEAACRYVESSAFDPAQVVILEGIRKTPPSPNASEAGPPGQAEVIVDDDRRVCVRVAANRDTWLVLADLFYPGWRAHLDGSSEAAEIVPANVACRAVRVPAGEHVVEFVYRPRSLRLGLWISAATLAGVLTIAGLLAIARLRAHRGSADMVRRR